MYTSGLHFSNNQFSVHLSDHYYMTNWVHGWQITYLKTLQYILVGGRRLCNAPCFRSPIFNRGGLCNNTAFNNRCRHLDHGSRGIGTFAQRLSYHARDASPHLVVFFGFLYCRINSKNELTPVSVDTIYSDEQINKKHICRNNMRSLLTANINETFIVISQQK